MEPAGRLGEILLVLGHVPQRLFDAFVDRALGILGGRERGPSGAIVLHRQKVSHTVAKIDRASAVAAWPAASDPKRSVSRSTPSRAPMSSQKPNATTNPSRSRSLKARR